MKDLDRLKRYLTGRGDDGLIRALTELEAEIVRLKNRGPLHVCKYCHRVASVCLECHNEGISKAYRKRKKTEEEERGLRNRLVSIRRIIETCECNLADGLIMELLLGPVPPCPDCAKLLGEVKAWCDKMVRCGIASAEVEDLLAILHKEVK